MLFNTRALNLSLIASAALLVCSMPAGAADECPNIVKCEGYPIVPAAGECDKCPDPGVAPTALLNCEASQGGYICEAYPQGFGVSYGWKLDPGLSIRTADNPTVPVVALNCDGTANSPRLEVIVYLASGLYDKESVILNCPEAPR